MILWCKNNYIHHNNIYTAISLLMLKHSYYFHKASGPKSWKALSVHSTLYNACSIINERLALQDYFTKEYIPFFFFLKKSK